MKEKELRIAQVCLGGVSLAVYKHGISKEILKLVRASSMLHSIVDSAERSRASFLDKVDRKDSEHADGLLALDSKSEAGLNQN